MYKKVVLRVKAEATFPWNGWEFLPASLVWFKGHWKRTRSQTESATPGWPLWSFFWPDQAFKVSPLSWKLSWKLVDNIGKKELSYVFSTNNLGQIHSSSGPHSPSSSLPVSSSAVPCKFSSHRSKQTNVFRWDSVITAGSAANRCLTRKSRVTSPSKHPPPETFPVKTPPFIISLISNFGALAVQLFHDIDFALAAVPVPKTVLMRWCLCCWSLGPNFTIHYVWPWLKAFTGSLSLAFSCHTFFLEALENFPDPGKDGGNRRHSLTRCIRLGQIGNATVNVPTLPLHTSRLPLVLAEEAAQRRGRVCARARACVCVCVRERDG